MGFSEGDTQAVRSLESLFPMTDKFSYLLTTDPGIEDLAAEEIVERVPGARAQPVPFGARGHLRVERATLDQILALNTIHHVIEIRGEAQAATLDDIRRAVRGAEFPELADARSFRVSTQQAGESGLTRREIQGAAGAVIQGRYGTAVDLEQFEFNVRVELCGSHVVVGLQRTDRALSKRLRRAQPLRTGIKPTIAAAMLRLAGAHRGSGRLLDPMCGAGTIPVEAKRINPALEVHASDWDAETLGIARRTVENHDLPIVLQPADARDLRGVYAEPFDYLVTDPPYGVRQARRTSIRVLYRNLLPSFEKVLAASGRIVLVILKRRVFELALEKTDLRVVHERQFTAGQLKPWIFALSHQG